MANFGALETLRNAYRTLIAPSTSTLPAIQKYGSLTCHLCPGTRPQIGGSEPDSSTDASL
jgi:hypothetical protein